MFDGPEPVFQTSNGVFEILVPRIQHPCFFNRNVAFQNSNRASKVGDEHPDVFRCLFRDNTAVGTVLNLMFHFHFPPGKVPSRRVTKETAPTN